VNAPEVSIQSWVECLKQSSEEIVPQTLRFDPSYRTGEVERVEGKCPGAYIALMGDRTSLHLGIAASPDGCRTIARGLLGAHRTTDVSDREVMDAVNEVLNIVAGKVKSKMILSDPTLQLGLPMFLREEIQVTEGMEKASARTCLGPVECELMVFRRALAA